MLDFEHLHQSIRQAGVEVHLDKDWNRNQHDVEISACDVLRLKRKNAYQGRQKGENRYGAEPRQKLLLKPVLASRTR